MGMSITKNLMYNLLLQIVNMVLPLVTVPYVSRILGTDGVGIYSYTYSITLYFIIVGTIGLSMYGIRQVAYTRDNKEDLSRTFWSILILRIITTSLATVLYVVIFWNSQTYREIFMLQTIVIVAAMIDVSWLYMGLEDFKKTVTRNLVVKLIGVCLIFALIKDRSDLELYVLINVLMLLLGNLVMWLYLPKTVKRVSLSIKDITGHLVPTIQLFIPQIAIQVYVVLDKSMLGWLANVDEVGLYTQSEKLIKAGLALVTALGTVMMPRMSNIFVRGDKETMNRYLNTCLRGVAYVAVPMSVGIAGVSNEFVPWFLGSEFEAATYLMMVLAPITFFIAMSNVMGMQYLLPSNRINEFTVSVTAGAAVNLALNFMLIPSYKALGACISTLVAEFSVTSIQFFFLKKDVDIKSYVQGLIKYIFACVILFVCVRSIGRAMGVGVITTLVQCVSGFVIYTLILKLLRESVNDRMIKTIIDRSRKILHKV